MCFCFVKDEQRVGKVYKKRFAKPGRKSGGNEGARRTLMWDVLGGAAGSRCGQRLRYVIYEELFNL
jgi:hypothetical protein